MLAGGAKEGLNKAKISTFGSQGSPVAEFLLRGASACNERTYRSDPELSSDCRVAASCQCFCCQCNAECMPRVIRVRSSKKANILAKDLATSGSSKRVYHTFLPNAKVKCFKLTNVFCKKNVML